MKAGIKTTEFWLTLISVVGLFVPTLMGLISPEKASIVIGILVGIYTAARAIVKMTSTTIDDTIIEAIGENIINKLGEK